MTPLPDVLQGVLGTALGLLVSSLSLLAIFVGFSVVMMWPKLRTSGGRSRVVRSLDEALGSTQTYLSPDAPRGRADQLRTPELLEAESRKPA